MTEPVDPNQPRSYEPPSYQPPPYQPPPSYHPQPAQQPGSYPPPYPPPYGAGPQQQYGGGPQQQYPGGWGGPDGNWAPLSPPPARRNRTPLIVALVVVLLVAAGVGAYFVFRSDGGSGKSGSTKATNAPGSFAGYTRLDNAAATQVKNSVRQMGQNLGGGAAGQLFAAATIAVYAHDSGDQPVLITLTVPTSAAGGGKSADDITGEMLSGATASNTSFPAGSHGGSVRCGLAQFGAVSETMCSWSDDAKSGLLVSVRESLQPRDLATVTNSFRNAVE